MRENYKFVRGEHPNETVAYLLAEDIASVLREKGKNVEVENVDERRTNIGHAKRLIAGEKLKPHISFRQGYSRAVHDHSSFFFNFHDNEWDGTNIKNFRLVENNNKRLLGGPYYCVMRPNYLIIELPAIFSEEDKEIGTGLDILYDLMKKSKAPWYAKAGPYTQYARFADVKASKKAGLMSKKLVRLYATNLDNIAVEYFSKVKPI